MLPTGDTKSICSIRAFGQSDKRQWKKPTGHVNDARKPERHKYIICVIRRGALSMLSRIFYRFATNVIVRFMERKSDGVNIAELTGIVSNSRARTNLVFPLPDVPGCVDYAICEAAETLDAILRRRRNGDKRNNDRQVNERIEWGQCGYMIASGLMQTDYDLTGYASNGGTVYDVLHWLAQEAVEMDGSLVDAMIDWGIYCKFEGWEPAQLLRDTCADFERKHVKEGAA